MAKEPFFLADAYRSYLLENVEIKKKSASSYVSDIVAIDRDLFGNLSNCRGQLLQLPSLLEKNRREAFALLDFLLETIGDAKREKDERFMSLHRLRNSYSAFSRYVSFITLRYATDDYFEQLAVTCGTEAGLEEDFDKSEVHPLRLAPDEDPDAVKLITREDLYKEFKKRLRTRDTPLNSREELFFPIKLIDGIFKEADGREYREVETQLKAFYPGFASFRQFIEDWLEESVEAIKVLSKDDEFLMRDVLRFELMPNRRSVNVVMASRNRFTLFTHQKGGRGERLPITEGMSEMSLGKITIEHINTMKSILDDNSGHLTGLQNLASLIRKKKKEKGISSTKWQECVKQLRPLISFEDIRDFAIEIVRDLLFIKENAHLELMGDKFNTNPGKRNK